MSPYARRVLFGTLVGTGVIIGTFCIGKGIQSIYAEREPEPCPTFRADTSATFADFAGSSPYFLKFYASSNEATYPAYSSKDGHKISLTRIGTSNDYTFNMTSIDNQQNKTEISSIYTVEETSHKVKKYGVWQNFQIMSFRKNAHALTYFCVQKDDGYELYRALMTTNLENDLSEPLQEDAKHNFKQPLFELPYKYSDLYS